MKSFNQLEKETDKIRNAEYKQKVEKEKADKEKTDRELLEAIEALRQSAPGKKPLTPERIKAWAYMMSLFQFVVECIDDPDVFDDEFIQDVSTSVKAIAEWHREVNIEKRKKKKKQAGKSEKHLTSFDCDYIDSMSFHTPDDNLT